MKRKRRMINRGNRVIIMGVVLCLSMVTLSGCQSAGKMVESVIQHAVKEETESEPYSRGFIQY